MFITLRYQHGCPRLVFDLSMMSSATRKKAWSYRTKTIHTEMSIASHHDVILGYSTHTHPLNTPSQDERLSLLLIGQFLAGSNVL